MSNIKIRAGVAMIALSALTVTSGCSKKLTQSRAVKLTQEVIDKSKGGVIVSIAPVTAVLAQEFSDAAAPVPPAILPLVQAGLIRRRTIPLKYPNIAGQYTGTYTSVFNKPLEAKLVVTLQDGSAPPRVQGTFETCAVWVETEVHNGPITHRNCGTNNVSGVLNANGATNLIFTVNALEPPTNMQLTLTRGNPDDLSGRVHSGSTDLPVKLQGHSGPDIQQSMYMYEWSDKLPKDALVSGYTVNGGRLIVDTCDQLLLQDETKATAICSGHLEPTGAVKTILGDGFKTISIRATYGKQPDGEWVGTAANHSPLSL